MTAEEGEQSFPDFEQKHAKDAKGSSNMRRGPSVRRLDETDSRQSGGTRETITEKDKAPGTDPLMSDGARRARNGQ